MSVYKIPKWLTGWSQSMRRRWRKAHPDRLKHDFNPVNAFCIHCGAPLYAVVDRILKEDCGVRPHP
jgi:hypothetical protein